MSFAYSESAAKPKLSDEHTRLHAPSVRFVKSAGRQAEVKGKWQGPKDVTKQLLCGDHDRLGLKVSQPLCSCVETTAEESDSNLDTETPETNCPTPHPTQSWTEQAAVGASLLPTKYPIAACLTESCGKRCPSKGSLKALTT